MKDMHISQGCNSPTDTLDHIKLCNTSLMSPVLLRCCWSSWSFHVSQLKAATPHSVMPMPESVMDSNSYHPPLAANLDISDYKSHNVMFTVTQLLTAHTPGLHCNILLKHAPNSYTPQSIGSALWLHQTYQAFCSCLLVLVIILTVLWFSPCSWIICLRTAWSLVCLLTLSSA